MWHEARRQEKKLRGMMVDLRKRAERRRDFYEKIKLDPTQYLRVVGRHTKINIDPAVAMAAEAPQSMQPWQGNSDIMIDRFDGRSHLDFIPEPSSNSKTSITDSDLEEERAINYERYRILVQNECINVTEENCLLQIKNDELFGAENNPALNAELHNSGSKKSENKVAIGYNYEDDGLSAKSAKNQPSLVCDLDSDSDEEMIDLDIALDLEELTNDQIQMLNSTATKYGMNAGDYFEALYNDKKEAEQIKKVRLLEEERAQFTGRKSRRERRAVKDKALQGKQHSPPSYAARMSPQYRSFSHSSSRSRSHSPLATPQFITSFGAGSSDEDEPRVILGPALPPHLMPHSDIKPATVLSSESNGASYSRSRSNSPYGSKSSHSKSQRRSDSRSRRRSTSTRRSQPRYRRSRQRSRSKRRTRSRSRHRARSRSRHRAHSRSRHRTRSRSRHRTRSRSRHRSRSYHRRSRSRSWSQRSRSKRSYSGSSSDSYSSKSYSSRSSSYSRAPIQKAPVIKRYRRDSLSSNASDSSLDSDNASANKSVAKSTTKRSTTAAGLNKSFGNSKGGGVITVQERMKRRMQMALNKNFKADKKAEQERLAKLEQEQMDREDELRSLSIQLRRREREKRHREEEEEYQRDLERSKRELTSKERSPKSERDQSKERERRHRRSRDRSRGRRSGDRSRSRDRRNRHSRDRRQRSRSRGDRDRRSRERYRRSRERDRYSRRNGSSERSSRSSFYRRSRSLSPRHNSSYRTNDYDNRKTRKLVDY